MLAGNQKNLESIALSPVVSPNASTHRDPEFSSVNLPYSDVFFDIKVESLPKDFHQHPAWLLYQQLLGKIVLSYSSKLNLVACCSTVLFYLAVTILPFGLLVQEDIGELAHMLYAGYMLISLGLEWYLCRLFTHTDADADQLEDEVHSRLLQAYPHLHQAAEEGKMTGAPWLQMTCAVLWGQLSRLDTYLHLCFVAVLSANSRHTTLWGLSLGLILLFLVLYNSTLCVLRSTQSSGVCISHMTRHLSAYLEFYGLYLCSSQFWETQVLDLSSSRLLNVSPSASQDVSPAVFRYLKWVLEDTMQTVLLLVYLHSEQLQGVVVCSVAVSLLMLVSGLVLLCIRDRLQVLLW